MAKRLFLCIIACTMMGVNGFSEVYKETTDKYSNHLKIYENPLTQMPTKIEGIRVDLERYGVDFSGLNDENIGSVCKNFLADYQDITKVNPEDLTLTRFIKDDKLSSISYQQIYRGIPIYMAKVGFSVNWRGFVTLGENIYPDISVETTPLISEEDAVEIAKESFQTADMDSVNLLNDVHLLIYLFYKILR